ncbi:MAG: hypothetical protein RR191_06840 [Cetobacterium sp.]|uniref:hypothetical protein n=1 Tax=Cetobacterium sp. TaxID=2071632 RepID=UPI002FC6F8CF
MGRSAKRRKEAKKSKKETRKEIELNVKEIRETAIKNRTEQQYKQVKYSVASQIGNVVANNKIIRGPRYA